MKGGALYKKQPKQVPKLYLELHLSDLFVVFLLYRLESADVQNSELQHQAVHAHLLVSSQHWHSEQKQYLC